MGSQGHPVPPHPSALPKPVGMRGRPQRVCPHVTDPKVVIGRFICTTEQGPEAWPSLSSVPPQGFRAQWDLVPLQGETWHEGLQSVGVACTDSPGIEPPSWR